MLTPYSSDLDRRLQTQSDSLHSLDPVYDHMGELAGDSVMLPAEVQALLQFLGVLIMDLAQVIRAIEDQYPQWAGLFASERQMYS